MRLRVVRHLVAHTRRQVKAAAVRQLGLELAGNAKEDMTLLTPVIGSVAGRVLDQPYPNCSELPSPPSRYCSVRMESGDHQRQRR